MVESIRVECHLETLDGKDWSRAVWGFPSSQELSSCQETSALVVVPWYYYSAGALSLKLALED